MSSDPLPADLAAAHAMILAQRELLTLAKSEVTVGRLEIERLKLMLAKARREQFGQSSERGKLLVEQLELAIEDLEETQAEQETRTEIAAPEAAKQKRAQNPRPPRRPLPDNLSVERIIEPAPCACSKCGSERMHKLGEVVSKTLECEPRRWKIIEHVREKFSCRDCEAITEAPAPSHPIPRGLVRAATSVGTPAPVAAMAAVSALLMRSRADIVSLAIVRAATGSSPFLTNIIRIGAKPEQNSTSCR